VAAVSLKKDTADGQVRAPTGSALQDVCMSAQPPPAHRPPTVEDGAT